MIYCSNCGLANRDGSKFCNECGSRLGVVASCPACGENNLPTARFCNACGARLSMDFPATCPPSNSPLEAGEAVAPEKPGERDAPLETVFTALNELESMFDGSSPELVEGEADTANLSAELIHEQTTEVKYPATSTLKMPDLSTGGQNKSPEVGAEFLQHLALLDAVVEQEGGFSSLPNKVSTLPSEFGETADDHFATVGDLGAQGTASALDPIAAVDEIDVAENLNVAGEPAQPDSSGVANSADLVDIDCFLPTWLMEMDESGTSQIAQFTKEEPASEAAPQGVGTNIWENHEESYLPLWERSNGIALAKSVAVVSFAARSNRRDERPADGVAAFLAALSSPWEPLSVRLPATETRETEKTKTKGSHFLRRALIYILFAVLAILAAVVISNTLVPQELRRVTAANPCSAEWVKAIDFLNLCANGID